MKVRPFSFTFSDDSLILHGKSEMILLHFDDISKAVSKTMDIVGKNHHRGFSCGISIVFEEGVKRICLCTSSVKSREPLVEKPVPLDIERWYLMPVGGCRITKILVKKHHFISFREDDSKYFTALYRIKDIEDFFENFYPVIEEIATKLSIMLDIHVILVPVLDKYRALAFLLVKDTDEFDFKMTNKRIQEIRYFNNFLTRAKPSKLFLTDLLLRRDLAQTGEQICSKDLLKSIIASVNSVIDFKDHADENDEFMEDLDAMKKDAKKEQFSIDGKSISKDDDSKASAKRTGQEQFLEYGGLNGEFPTPSNIIPDVHEKFIETLVSSSSGIFLDDSRTIFQEGNQVFILLHEVNLEKLIYVLKQLGKVETCLVFPTGIEKRIFIEYIHGNAKPQFKILDLQEFRSLKGNNGPKSRDIGSILRAVPLQE